MVIISAPGSRWYPVEGVSTGNKGGMAGTGTRCLLFRLTGSSLHAHANKELCNKYLRIIWELLCQDYLTLWHDLCPSLEKKLIASMAYSVTIVTLLQDLFIVTTGLVSWELTGCMEWFWLLYNFLHRFIEESLAINFTLLHPRVMSYWKDRLFFAPSWW